MSSEFDWRNLTAVPNFLQRNEVVRGTGHTASGMVMSYEAKVTLLDRILVNSHLWAAELQGQVGLSNDSFIKHNLFAIPA